MGDGERVVVVGAGPAGLTAALALARRGRPPLVLEALPRAGGIARTEEHNGFLFDMGGHRFFTKLPRVEEIWRGLLGADLLVRPRLSRIYYRGRFFAYPLKPLDALVGLGPWAGLAIVGSYLRWRLRPYPEEHTFEQWVTNRFGRRLFLTFFKSYTEKVWGIPCSELRAEWAAQRIRDLSLKAALAAMFSRGGSRVRTLIDEFLYPRRGPGMLWERAAAEVEARGGRVLLGHRVAGIRTDGGRVASLTVERNGGVETVPCDRLVSSMAVTDLVAALEPAPPPAVLAAAAGLRFRDFLTVGLIVDRGELFPDQWIYVHDPAVRMGRMQNYRNWSPEMCPEPGRTGLGLEYFCNRGDGLWSMADADLVALGREEVAAMGLAPREAVAGGRVFRVPKAYPVYDEGYRERLDAVRAHLAGVAGLQTVGRNGLFRYNNMDHSMATALLAAENVLDGGSRDVWAVNDEREYHEAGPASSLEPGLSLVVARVFQRVDRVALGVALGAVAGGLLGAMTLALVLKGGVQVGPTLGLLAQFFPGYAVTLPGVLLGFLYGFLAGFLAGWAGAALRNLVVALMLIEWRGQARRQALRRILDCL